MENRTHNVANEVQTTCTHDRNGNMTVMPGLQGKYDAWSRLVEVRNASNALLVTYAYNGANQRIKQTVSSTTITTSFFNENWQELESSVTTGQTTRYIWGTRYIDDLVLREKGSEKLYSFADPNWNVVALTDASGIMQERMKYDAFGKVTWMTAVFATKGSSSYDWNRTFTGQVLDAESGLMLYRNRFYHTGLGRFVQRDPIGYEGGGISLYRYAENGPTNKNDDFGLLSSQQAINCCASEDESNSWGDPADSYVMCCDNKPLICNNVGRLQGIPRNLKRILEECVSDHEASHILDIDCEGKGTTADPCLILKNISLECTECKADQADITCLEKRKRQCGKDSRCKVAIDEILKALRDRRDTNCAMCDFQKEAGTANDPPKPRPKVPVDPFL